MTLAASKAVPWLSGSAQNDDLVANHPLHEDDVRTRRKAFPRIRVAGRNEESVNSLVESSGMIHLIIPNSSVYVQKTAERHA